MRQVLFRIPLDQTIVLAGKDVPIFGLGLLLGLWVALSVWWTIRHLRRFGADQDLQGQVIFEVIVAAIIWKLPTLMNEIRIFGYGAAMVTGFLIAAWLAAVRAKREGIEPSVIWDLAMTVLFSGVIGARMFWVLQNAGAIFQPGRKVQEMLFDVVNLPNGGLVLYGGVILGIVAYIIQCRRMKLSTLRMADILIASIFVGETFGRIGCFLNGCCYGDASAWSWPWAVQFPPGSPAYAAQVNAGIITTAAACSQPLLPTQLYSSANAVFLAMLTWFYYPYRTRHGEVLLVGWLLYPIARFCLEIVRDEPPGIFGTWMTIAQEISIGLFASGLVFAWYVSRQPRLERTTTSDGASLVKSDATGVGLGGAIAKPELFSSTK